MASSPGVLAGSCCCRFDVTQFADWLSCPGPVWTLDTLVRSNHGGIGHRAGILAVPHGIVRVPDGYRTDRGRARCHSAENMGRPNKPHGHALSTLCWRKPRKSCRGFFLFQGIGGQSSAKSLWRLRHNTGWQVTKRSQLVRRRHDLAQADRSKPHDTFPLDRLSRYEHMLWRQARQLVATLHRPKRRFHFR